MGEHFFTGGTEVPNNNTCWAIAKKVWPELKDEDNVMTRAKYTSMVSDIAWNGHYDYRLKKGEAAAIQAYLLKWRQRDSLPDRVEWDDAAPATP